MTYSEDLKNRIMKYYTKTNLSFRKLEQIYDVSKTTIHRWISSSETNVIRTKNAAKGMEFIRDYISQNPMTQLKHIREYLINAHEIKLSKSTIFRRIRKLGITRKKVKKRYKMTSNSDILKQNFINKIKAYKGNILCLDETSFDIHSYNKYGYSKKGDRCYYDIKKIPRHRRLNGIFIISKNKIVDYELFRKPINKDSMLEFLKKSDIKDSIIMDNLAVHHSKVIKEYLKDKSVDIFYNVPYSPELNPIEEVFGVLKNRIRQKCIDNEEDLKLQIEKEVEKLNDEVNIGNFYRHSFGI